MPGRRHEAARPTPLTSPESLARPAFVASPALAARGRILDPTPLRPFLKFCAGLLGAPIPVAPDTVEISPPATAGSAGVVRGGIGTGGLAGGEVGASGLVGEGGCPAPYTGEGIATWLLSSPGGGIPLVLTIRVRCSTTLLEPPATRAPSGAPAVSVIPGLSATPDLSGSPALSATPAVPTPIPHCHASLPRATRAHGRSEHDPWWCEVDVGPCAPACATAVLDSLASYLQLRALRFVVLAPPAQEWRLLLPAARA